MAKRSEKKSTLQRGMEFERKTYFAHNAFILFKKANEIVTKCLVADLETWEKEKVKHILDQMLHSILFLGRIHSKYREDDIFDHIDILKRMRSDFPKPFKQYQTHVALRTPFSFFLELLTYYGQSNEENVKRELSEILDDCKKSGDEYTLISIVICICESGKSRQYGASLSCGSDIAKNIMTAVSCLHVWHPKVSSAVMSVLPDGAREPRSIKLPDTVRCRAYAMEDLRQLKPPCKTCNELYSLPDPTTNPNTPGNCAETEAISNLLSAEEGVSNQTTITGGVYDKSEIKQKMESDFNTNMKKLRKTNDGKYKIDDVYGSN